MIDMEIKKIWNRYLLVALLLPAAFFAINYSVGIDGSLFGFASAVGLLVLSALQFVMGLILLGCRSGRKAGTNALIMRVFSLLLSLLTVLLIWNYTFPPDC